MAGEDIEGRTSQLPKEQRDEGTTLFGGGVPAKRSRTVMVKGKS